MPLACTNGHTFSHVTISLDNQWTQEQNLLLSCKHDADNHNTTCKTTCQIPALLEPTSLRSNDWYSAKQISTSQSNVPLLSLTRVLTTGKLCRRMQDRAYNRDWPATRCPYASATRMKHCVRECAPAQLHNPNSGAMQQPVLPASAELRALHRVTILWLQLQHIHLLPGPAP